MSATDPNAGPQGPGASDERPRRSGRLPNLAERLAELDRKLSEQPAPDVAPNATSAQSDMSFTSFSSLAAAEPAPAPAVEPAPAYQTTPSFEQPAATYDYAPSTPTAAPVYEPPAAPVYEPTPAAATTPVYEPPAAPVYEPTPATPTPPPFVAPVVSASTTSPSTETINGLRTLYKHRDDAQRDLESASKPVDYSDKLSRAHAQLAEAEKAVDEYIAAHGASAPSRDSHEFGATPAGELLGLRRAVVKDLAELNQDYDAWMESTGRALHAQISRISDDIDATERILLGRFETLESELPRYDAAALDDARSKLSALAPDAREAFEGQLLQAKVDFLELQAIRSEKIKSSAEGVAKLSEQAEIARVLLDPSVTHGPSIQAWFSGLSSDRRVFFASLTSR